MDKLEFHVTQSHMKKSWICQVTGSKQFLHGRGLDATLVFHTFLRDESPLPKPARLYLSQVHGG